MSDQEPDSAPDYERLRNHLETRISTISDAELRERDPAEQLRRLQSSSEGITQWHDEFKAKIPAQLNHFLKQSSLTKAQEFIQEM